MIHGASVESEITHFHLFCGGGGGARGFNEGHARVGRFEARFRCLGGVDSDPHSIRDFGRLAGVPGTVLDLFTREQYRAFHGQEPPQGWREATAADLLAAAGGECPDIVFTSPPCRGFSGLLSNAASSSPRYRALNELTLRGVELALEAFADRLPSLFILENVPRIEQRGADLLDEIKLRLELSGYAVAFSRHDCGEIGGLAQHRRRFLLLARLKERIRPFLYEPPRLRVRGIGEVLGPLPMPDDPAGGPMHRLPRLTWGTWVRLALILAGGDWRSLHDIDHTKLTIAPYSWGRGRLGVTPWEEPAATVAGESLPNNGRFSVADPRQANGARFNNVLRLARRDEPCPAVTAGAGPSSGGVAVADPRRCGKRPGNDYDSQGTYGVLAWRAPSGAVVGKAKLDTGRWSVADPRMPSPGDRPDPPPVIIALDDTWHRPLTTLELAALQGFPVFLDGAPLVLDGTSHTRWRERVGNAVPIPAAAAIASVMGDCLLRARLGRTFGLSALPVWVQPFASALSVATAGDTA